MHSTQGHRLAASTSRLGARRGPFGLACLCVLGLAAFLGNGAHAAGADPACPNEEIRQQQGSTYLPECMAYELVSPADAIGGAQGIASLDGDHAWMAPIVPVLPNSTIGAIDSLAVTRTPAGWQTRDLANPNPPDPNLNDEYLLGARATNSSATIVERCREASILSCSGDSTYERVAADGTRTIMMQLPNLHSAETVDQLAGISDDASSVFVNTGVGRTLLPEDTHSQGRDIYASRNGQLEFLGYDEYENVLDCGAILGKGTNALGTGFEQNGISPDGQTITYEAPDPRAECSEPTDVYIRSRGAVVNISKPRNANPDEGADYVGSSRSGDVAYFITKSQLVASDIDNVPDLYRYDLSSDSVTRITPGADVQSAVVSPSGDYVYFTAPQAIGGQGADGQLNLYLAHAGAIADIATATDGGGIRIGGGRNQDSESPLTPDGRHLLFTATTQLTSQPTGGHVVLYDYDAGTQTLVCISCHPDGIPPATDYVPTSLAPPGNVDQRVQSDDGSTVVFESLESLLPQDVNGPCPETRSCRDVYMWHDGALSLISSGTSQFPSSLDGLDAAGHNVFFSTTDRLIPGVEQDFVKAYDARVNGGFRSPSPSTPCAGDSCRSPLSTQPGETQPASSSFCGPANPKTRRHHKRRHHPLRHHRRANHNHRGCK